MKKRPAQCPECFGPLEVREVAPCFDCGWDPTELEHFRDRKHVYSELEVFPGLTLILCDFCQVDFGSYDPTFFGLPRGRQLCGKDMHFLRTIADPSLGKDLFCPACNRRKTFLDFVQAARIVNAT